MPFVITGDDPSGQRSATRMRPASAIVLAMRWSEDGVRGVQIMPSDEEAQHFRDFQAKFYKTVLPVSVRYPTHFDVV